MPKFVPVDNSKKVDGLKLPVIPKFEPYLNFLNPIYNPWKESSFHRFNWFGKLNANRTRQIKLPVPGEGLPRVYHYCADQGGCAFWRLIFPGDEMLANNKAVIQTFYQMILDPRAYFGISAIRLQRQCSKEQLEFIKHLRNISEELKRQGQPGFRIIYEVDDLIDLPSINLFNLCRTAFTDPEIVTNVKEIVHNCVVGDTLVCVSLDGIIVDITIEEVLEHFNDGKNIKILSKDISKNTICFKTITDCKITDTEAEVIEIYDDVSGIALICTKDHPIYTKNRSWVKAADILPSDVLDIL